MNDDAPRFSFWVSPTGDDSAAGTKAAPFLTLDRARDAVRAVLNRQDRDVIVNIRAGTYRLDHPLVLTSRDSGRNGFDVVYRAAPGEHPVITGARAVPPSNWQLVDPGLTGWLWAADAGPGASRQLYVNGERATRARSDPYPAGFLPHWLAGSGSGIQYIPTLLNPLDYWDPTAWDDVDDVEAVIRTQWREMRVPLDGTVGPYVPGGPPGLIGMQQPAWDNANVFLSAQTGAPGIWSFWQVTSFENALAFLDEPGEWYFDEDDGTLYYMTTPLGDPALMSFELPRLQTLVRGKGAPGEPVENLRFEGLTFTGATWLGPSSDDGYVSDQNGFRLTGPDHAANIIGHDPHDVPTPGNVRFRYAHDVTFTGNIFEHLGGVGLAFGTGSQRNHVQANLFSDISSSAITIGGISPIDAHPAREQQITLGNRITGNLVQHTGADYADTAAITAGFTRRTIIANNTIHDVPWTGISMGWGWGLLDPGGFPGVPGAVSGQWGKFDEPTPNGGSVIRDNHIDGFLQVLWDGGAIYTTGFQGTTMADGLLLEGNVATNKRPSGGGNTFYTDGGSRYVTVRGNVSIDNPVGAMDFGPPPQVGDPLPYPATPSAGNGVPYGSDLGGCVTYGDIRYEGNYWLQDPFSQDVAGYNFLYQTLLGFAAYSNQGFFDICPYTDGHGITYPTNLTFKDNHVLHAPAAVRATLDAAGVRSRPPTIPADRWNPPEEPLP